MFYHYLRIFNWVSSVFGLYKPFPSVSGKNQSNLRRWVHVWSLLVAIAFIGSYFYPNNYWAIIRFKTHLDEIASTNNLIVNVFIIVINVSNSGKLCTQLYSIINEILRELHIEDHNIKLLAIKLYVWMTIPFTILMALVVMEVIFANPPYTLIIKMPILISILHLIIHIALMLAVLKVINLRFSEKFKIYNNFFLHDYPKSKSKIRYSLSPTIRFLEVNIQKDPISIKLLCKIYDDMGICIKLLQNIHGIQIFLSVWLMFSNAVTGITLITHERANMAWVVIVRSTLPFFWYFMGCYIDNQLRQEVERTEILIIKHFTDFRCDQSTREVLQTFRLVVVANRLDFTACNLFHLNYATILGTVVNVITYSIILIQIL